MLVVGVWEQVGGNGDGTSLDARRHLRSQEDAQGQVQAARPCAVDSRHGIPGQGR